MKTINYILRATIIIAFFSLTSCSDSSESISPEANPSSGVFNKSYKGFDYTIDYSKKNIAKTEQWFFQEIDRIGDFFPEDLKNETAIHQFMKNVPIILESDSIKASFYSIANETITLRKQQNYTLLHELMHAYWFQYMNDSEKLQVRDIFQKTRKKTAYKKTDYVLHDLYEYWAVSAATFLAGKSTSIPTTYDEIRKSDPELFNFLHAHFCIE